MKKVAVFCPIKDEHTHIWRWLDYYTSALGKENVYVIDFGSSPEYLGKVSEQCNIIPTQNNIHDAYELFQTILDTHKNLQEEYDFVIPVDVDEIIYHKDGLQNYIGNLDKDFVTCNGYEILHLPDRELSFDPSSTLFKQRNHWYKSHQYYAKTLVTSKTLDWTIGLHTVVGVDKESSIDEDLYLIHLHRFDFNTCMKRHLSWAEMDWSDDTVKNNWNYHYRTHDRKKLQDWYFEPMQTNSVEEIPSFIKTGILI